MNDTRHILKIVATDLTTGQTAEWYVPGQPSDYVVMASESYTAIARIGEPEMPEAKERDDAGH